MLFKFFFYNLVFFFKLIKHLILKFFFKLVKFFFLILYYLFYPLHSIIGYIIILNHFKNLTVLRPPSLSVKEFYRTTFNRYFLLNFILIISIALLIWITNFNLIYYCKESIYTLLTFLFIKTDYSM